MLGQFITGFAGRSFVVALPTIANTLHADILGISWAIIAYQLAGISLSVVFGRLGDIHGRYAIYGTGFAIMAGARSSAAWRRASCGSTRDIKPHVGECRGSCAAVQKLPTPVSLDRIKADQRLTGMALVRLPRLSVQPVSKAEWRIVCQIGGLG